MNKERRSEAIWIEQRGRWQVNVQLDGKRKTFCSSTPGRKGKHEAEAKADDWLDANAPDDMRFDAAYKLFQEYIKKNTSSVNYKNIESIGKNWFLDSKEKKRLSSIKLSKLKPSNFQQIVNEAAEEGKSKRTCSNIRNVAARFFSFAEDMGWSSISLKSVKIPASAHSNSKRVMQPDKVKVLFSDDTITKYNKKERFFYIHACRFLVLMGYRRGELCGFRNEDFDGSTLSVNRSINRLGEVTPGKNENARRTNVLPRMALDILADQKAMLKDKGIISPWIFPDEKGNRLDPNALYKAWSVYSEQHGINVNLHELRHTFISIAKFEMPLELLKDVVGHSAKMDTTGVYGHLIDGEKQRAADCIDTVFSKILP